MTNTSFSIGIIVKTEHPEAANLLSKLLSHLASHNYSVLVESRSAGIIDDPKIPSKNIVPHQELSKKCKYIIVLGGDGTLISVAHHPSSHQPIILGVNLGTLGFLTEFDVDDMFVAINSLLNGELELQRHPLLNANIKTDKTTNSTTSCNNCFALNDIVVAKQTLSRILSLEICIDGELSSTSRGDGIIIATPSGSTAYSLSAGGSIVHPQVDAMLLTPICSHSLSMRPLVLPLNSVITLKMPKDKNNDTVHLTVDGQEGYPLGANDKVVVTVSTYSVLIAKPKYSNYCKTLVKKLKWGGI